MIKALAITDNIQFLSDLINFSSASNLNLYILAVSKDIVSAYNAFDFDDYDIIFVESKLFNNKNKNLLIKYKHKIVSISIYEISRLPHLKIIKKLSSNSNNIDFISTKKNIIKELEYLGFNFKYKGTHYLVDAILKLCTAQTDISDNLQNTLYPSIAKEYNKTPHNIKNSIINATEYMYRDCDSTKLKKYFSFSNDSKPTVKEVIFTITNKIV